ncbi:hypothetical protein F2P81_007649 [Scophthalmus maximus]|uniref:Uncharacterized protein n=1 Tax=Scophthalmus maximus TaxID=52904 RepID=A0A6A4T881_SCOMX|nr:hypothetical protein F2P81_007649 [Scophthalmus maximus]
MDCPAAAVELIIMLMLWTVIGFSASHKQKQCTAVMLLSLKAKTPLMEDERCRSKLPLMCLTRLKTLLSHERSSFSIPLCRGLIG